MIGSHWVLDCVDGHLGLRSEGGFDNNCKEKTKMRESQEQTMSDGCFAMFLKLFIQQLKLSHGRYTHFGSRVLRKQRKTTSSQERYVSQKLQLRLESGFVQQNSILVI